MKQKILFLSLLIAFVAIGAAQAQTCKRCGDTGVIRETCLSCKGQPVRMATKHVPTAADRKPSLVRLVRDMQAL